MVIMGGGGGHETSSIQILNLNPLFRKYKSCAANSIPELPGMVSLLGELVENTHIIHALNTKQVWSEQNHFNKEEIFFELLDLSTIKTCEEPVMG